MEQIARLNGGVDDLTAPQGNEKGKSFCMSRHRTSCCSVGVLSLISFELPKKTLM